MNCRSRKIYTALPQKFGSQSAAFAYMLFVLLYFPCSAAIAAVYRETNLAWAGFAGFWTTFLAFVASTLFYQTVNFAAHPRYSSLVITTDLCALIAVVALLKFASSRTAADLTVSAATTQASLAAKS